MFLIVGVVCLVIAVTSPAWAIEKQSGDKLMEANYSMAGIRLGIFADMADTEPIEDLTIDADLPDAGFHTELFLDYRLLKTMMVELSFGISSRGDAVIIQNDDRYIGTINLYTVLLQLKFSPLSGRSRTLLPFILGGGGVVFGRQSIDYVTSYDPYYNPDVVNKTETAFVGVMGGGVDIAVSEQVGLNIVAKYYPITFGDPLAGVSDYSGLTVAVGVAYFLHKK